MKPFGSIRKSAEAYYSRGVAYDKKGDHAKADADVAEARKLGYKSGRD